MKPVAVVNENLQIEWAKDAPAIQVGMRLCLMPAHPSAEAADAERLDWLSKRSFEVGYTDDEPGEVGIWLITGGRNDRVYRLAGQGKTLREAIDSARSGK